MCVTRPTAAIQQAVGDFVDAFNQLQTMIKEATANGTDGSAGPLRGDLGVQQMQRQLQQLGKRESAFLRLRRTKLGLDDFRTVKVIGKGAFGEVRPRPPHAFVARPVSHASARSVSCKKRTPARSTR